MNIFEKITAKSLRKNRSRTVVTLIGVMLSVAMITGVIAFAASLRSYTIEGAKETMGDWYAMVKPITKAQQEALTGAEGLQRIGTYEEIGYGAYLGEGEGLPKSVLVAGYDEALLEMQKVKLTSGALPQTEREVILPIDFQDEHRKTFAPGETLELKVGGETKVYTITGIYTKPKNYGNNTQDKYAAITVQTQKNSERIVAFITTEKAKNIQEFVQENFPDKAVKYNRGLLQFMSITGGGFFVTFTTFLSGFLILLIIFGSALLIYNNFSLSVEGKLKEFGILSSIGATRHQIRLAVLYEGLYFSMIAIPTGVLLGLLGTEITFYLLRGNFDDIIENGISTRLSLDISFALILLAVGISFATIMVSAWIPAAKGSRRSAVEAIFRREESELIQKQGKFSSLFSQRLSFPGFLALKNFRKNSKKYRATTLSLFLSIILFVMASTVGHYFVKTMNGVYGHEEGYQITFSEFQEKGLIQDQNYKALSEAKGILSATRVKIGIYEGIGGPVRDVAVMEVEDDFYQHYLQRQGIIGDPGIGLVAVETVMYYDYENQVYSEIAAITPGQKTIDLITPEGTGQTVPISATAKGRPWGASGYEGLQILVGTKDNIHRWLSNYQEEVMGQIAFFNTKTTMETYKDMERICAEQEIEKTGLTNIEKDKRVLKSSLLIINVFSYGFILLLSLIAVANVFNTISTNIFIRRREFAMLKAVGMDQKSFKRMLYFEFLFYGMKILALGIPFALLLSLALSKGLHQGLTEGLYIAGRSILISTLSVFAIILATMKIEARKIKDYNIIDAIKEENS